MSVLSVLRTYCIQKVYRFICSHVLTNGAEWNI